MRYILELKEVTRLLKDNGVNSVAKKLKIKKSEIYNLLKENGLEYINKEVRPIEFNNKDITKVICSNTGVEKIGITKVLQRNKHSNNTELESFIQKDNKSIDINKLKELIELLEPLKEIISKHNKSKNIVDIEPIELKVRNITEVKQKLFKIDVDVLNDWEQFVAEHKQYKVQNLISLALEEFINKYK